MKILKQGTQPSATCKVCGTQFQYDRSNTSNFYRKKFFGLIKRQVTFVSCPYCDFPVKVKHQKNYKNTLQCI